MKTLKTYMAENNISNSEVASAIGATEATVSRWRNKHTVPSVEMMGRIKEFTNGEVTADSFY